MSNFDLNEMEKTFTRLLDKEKVEKQIEEGRKNWIKEEKENPNNFSYWFVRLAHLDCVPSSIVFKLPDWMLDAYLTPEDEDKVYAYFEKNVIPIVQQAFPSGECFMKNGCFSNKFDFSSACHLTDLSTDNIIKHFFNIENMALLYETNGDLEVVFRQYIKANEKTPTIYNGMPFRTELRAFYDFDKHEYLYDVFYWDWDYCHDKMPERDMDTYEKNYYYVCSDYEENQDFIKHFLEEKLKDVDLKGKWSVDVLVDDDNNYWIIDMAIAERSAYWDPEKRAYL